MPSKDPRQRFEDILENIALIETFTSGMDLDSFKSDPKTTNAVERCLERISEAAKKLGDTGELVCPQIPWHQLRAVGNLLRHEYNRIEVSRVWLMVEDDLPYLKAAVEVAIRRLSPGI